ncbi:hypothetical protein SAMN05216577_12462 [Pseudomonas citronellolis]|uniref:Uncharacterized protein n=2 Tax=Pseudomonas TaxID=286 RepID=A0A239F888_9PSED|nr:MULTISPECIES: hypothetical protein [Pseudomonas]QOF88413.1 hypothetical protein IG194_16860 [Pseudomonas sp. ADPe]SDI12925.1 hypothetical protein SAMN05216189_1002186 [Pseudomonas delhiensis]SFD38283.1 hypothetical protein SAMN05216577_12462 [Pseudomonas citronellolis]SNS52698.1 hypothetical protein SAMN06295949_10372 [Pseudomonas delhiensis]
MVMHLVGRPAAKPTGKPKPRTKKGARDPLAVVEQAARAGDAQYQYFVETGKLPDSK